MTAMKVQTLAAMATFTCLSVAGAALADDLRESTVRWESDYAAAMSAAEHQNITMAVYFAEDGNDQCSHFDNQVMLSPDAVRRLNQCSRVRLPLDAEITTEGEKIQLLEHPAFAGLLGSPGLIFFDFSSKGTARGRVLRVLPFNGDRPTEASDLRFLADPLIEQAVTTEPFSWMTDYAEAIARAETEQRMLLIYFERSDGSGGCTQFEADTLSNLRVRQGLESYVCLKLAHDARVNTEDAETVLLRHSSFYEMVGLPGIAVVDFSNPDASYFGQVVSTFPFLAGNPYDPAKMDVILDLPPGELTQRTLVYAVRTHPDAPQSTSGELDLYLVSEAESHSEYQARIRLQGHHSWESRFHKINRRLPGGLLASEVCAESWPGQNLLEAAIDCVHCWRQSSGHWRSVKTAHPVFGYDIRRGSNGIWYATGIFGKRGR